MQMKFEWWTGPPTRIINDTVLRTVIFRYDPKNKDAAAPTTPLIIDFKESFAFSRILVVG